MLDAGLATTPKVLMLPGWQGSGPEHWQSHWERRLGLRALRVEQCDWDEPRREDWVPAIAAAVREQREAHGPVYLVAHSLGCIAAVHLAQLHPELSGVIRGALLVAPADIERDGARPQIHGFAPIPMRPLPFPSTLVASTDDPYCAFDRARTFADAWGSELVRLDRAGHIHAQSGHGPWPEGLALLERRLAEASTAGFTGA